MTSVRTNLKNESVVVIVCLLYTCFPSAHDPSPSLSLSLSLSLFLFLEATATCIFNEYPLIYTLKPNEVRLVSLPTQELFGILFVPQHDATRATERVDLSYGQKPPLTYTVCSA